MKRLLILLFASVALFSCGDDDSASGSSLKPTAITIGDNAPILLAYDDEDRVQSISMEGIASIFTYDGKNRVERVTTGADFYRFTYDENGKYTSMVDEGGNVTPFTHISDNQYMVNGVAFSFESNGDIKKYEGFTFSYSNKKGPFANVRHFNPLALMFGNSLMLYVAAKKRRVSITAGNEVVPFMAVEGDKGLPASEILEGGMIQYSYSE